MKRRIVYPLLLFLCGATMLLTTGCNKSDDDKTPTGTDQIKTLADLKALFDKGEITHIDFVTKDNRVLLDEEIETIVIVPQTSVFNFELMQIVTMSPPLTEGTSDDLRQRNTTSLTFADEIINSDLQTTHWAQTVTSLHGTEVESFAPHAFLIDSEISTASLAILGDKLQIKLKKK